MCRSVAGKNLTLAVDAAPVGIEVSINSATPDDPSTKFVNMHWHRKEEAGAESASRQEVRLRAAIGDQTIIVSIPIICQPDGEK
jgi:hypothetical protein